MKPAWPPGCAVFVSWVRRWGDARQILPAETVKLRSQREERDRGNSRCKQAGRCRLIEFQTLRSDAIPIVNHRLTPTRLALHIRRIVIPASGADRPVGRAVERRYTSTFCAHEKAFGRSALCSKMGQMRAPRCMNVYVSERKGNFPVRPWLATASPGAREP